MSTKANSPFWEFSLRLYKQHQVADSCLQLQDTAEVDVNVMLYLLWLASQHRELDAADVGNIIAAVADWKRDAVLPLRAIRRTLKQPKQGYVGIDSNTFREKVKALELQAEKLQQELLFELKAPDRWGAVQVAKLDAAKSNLLAYEETLGTRFGTGEIDTILQALTRLGD